MYEKKIKLRMTKIRENSAASNSAGRRNQDSAETLLPPFLRILIFPGLTYFTFPSNPPNQKKIKG